VWDGAVRRNPSIGNAEQKRWVALRSTHSTLAATAKVNQMGARDLSDTHLVISEIFRAINRRAIFAAAAYAERAAEFLHSLRPNVSIKWAA
jgi:antirestriction protein ArdC